jgi:hypothetical protein
MVVSAPHAPDDRRTAQGLGRVASLKGLPHRSLRVSHRPYARSNALCEPHRGRCRQARLHGSAIRRSTIALSLANAAAIRSGEGLAALGRAEPALHRSVPAGTRPVRRPPGSPARPKQRALPGAARRSAWRAASDGRQASSPASAGRAHRRFQAALHCVGAASIHCDPIALTRTKRRKLALPVPVRYPTGTFWHVYAGLFEGCADHNLVRFLSKPARLARFERPFDCEPDPPKGQGSSRNV